MAKDNQEISNSTGPNDKKQMIAEQFWPNKVPWPVNVVTTAVDANDPLKGNFHAICTEKGKTEVKEGDWIITGAGKIMIAKEL